MPAHKTDLQIFGDPLSFRRFREVHGVAGRGDERRGTEIAHKHQLALGVARRHGNNGSPQFFNAVMQAESPRKQAVAERYLKYILVRCACHGQNTRDTGGPIVQIGARIAAHDGFARRAAGRVQTDDLFHRHGKQSERIVVPQIVLCGIRNEFDVLKRLDMLGLQTDRVKAIFVHGHVFVAIAHDVFQPFQLHFPQYFSVDLFHFRTEHCKHLSPVPLTGTC